MSPEVLPPHHQLPVGFSASSFISWSDSSQRLSYQELSPTNSLTSQARTSTNGPHINMQHPKTLGKIIGKIDAHQELQDHHQQTLTQEIVIDKRIEDSIDKKLEENILETLATSQQHRPEQHRHPTSHWRATSQHRREGVQQQQGRQQHQQDGIWRE